MSLLVNIDVPDIEAGVAFYCGAFGLEVGAAARSPSGRADRLAARSISWRMLRVRSPPPPSGGAMSATGRRCISMWWSLPPTVVR